MNADWYPGITAFCLHWQHAPTLQQTFLTMEQEHASGNDASIDAAKALVECVCRVLIRALEDPSSPQSVSQNPDLSELVGLATKMLGLGEVRHRAFADLIKQHNKLTETLRVLRNEAGTVSHGKDGFIAKLSVHHRRSALLAADAIVTFLHEAYLERELDPVRTIEPYERFAASNALIDEFTGLRTESDEDGFPIAVAILPNGDQVRIPLEASKLLFGTDRQAYKDAVTACREARAIANPQQAAA